MTWLLVLTVGVASGTLGGIVGFGSTLIMLPVLVATFGAKAAVPVMIVAALMANASRVLVWWRDVDWKACAVYTSTALPMSALGARTLISLDGRVVELALGGFFLLMIPVRRWLAARGLRISLGQLAIVGAFIGFLSGIVASTGPINTPFFLAYGLTKGAFLATEALGSVAVQLTKATIFHTFGALPWEHLKHGLVVGASLMLGSWIAKSFVQRIEPARFNLLIDALMGTVGLLLVSGVLT
jgi:uncharacterized protein